MPYVNTEAMQVFLDRFAATIGDDEHVAMVLDQAGWHGSGALRIPDNITLVPLPPYSPELNPVERVWLHLKERFLSHRLLADYDAIADAACHAWNRLCAEAGRLTATVNRLRTDPDFIEQVAREDLGLVKPGERILKLPPSPGQRGR
jgi:hypothetical protein